MDIHLAHDEALSFNGDARGLAITCNSGVLWITIEGDNRDILLHPGEKLQVAQNGKVVVEARRAAALRVIIGPVAAGRTSLSPCLCPNVL